MVCMAELQEASHYSPKRKVLTIDHVDKSEDYSGADLGVGPEGHRPLLKSDWPLKCPCPVSHR